MPARKTKPGRPRPDPPAAPSTPADLAALPVRHEHAAGIDVGDLTHWACVGRTPDGSDTVREFPAHTPGLRDVVAWLRHCGVTTVALEASGAYGHVLFLTLVEAGFAVVMTSPSFTRQIKGRPKTDRRDCQWIRRLHAHGLLASGVPAGRRHPGAPQLRPPAGQPGPPVRPARPADAEGPGPDEPEADRASWAT